MLLSKQIATIDYTYKLANGKPFSINSLTSPLWINIVWTYLYKWYGEKLMDIYLVGTERIKWDNLIV